MDGHDMSDGRVLIIEQGGRGGVTDYVDALSSALVESGVDVELLTAHDHRYPEVAGRTVLARVWYLRESGPVSRTLRRAGLGRLLNGLAYVGTLPVMFFRARRSDVSHLQGAEWPPLLALTALVMRAAGRPVVLTVHNTFERGRPYVRSNRLAQRVCARIIVHTQVDMGSLEESARHKAVVIPHGNYAGLAGQATVLPDRAEARRKVGVAPGSLVVLLFGQLRPDKGLADLLTAAIQTPEVHVLVAGQEYGALGENQRLLTDPALVDRLTVQEGFLSMDEAADVFASADVVALPYARASASGVLLLAYGFERPVVAYPVGGLIEYVRDGETGWLTKTPSVEALCETLAAVVAAGEAECQRRGRVAAALARDEWSWEAIADRTIELYQSLGIPVAARQQQS
jgi:glycosyltransferase involved in cell wall biosynthesis